MGTRKIADEPSLISDYPEHFCRQRRNLLAASMLALIYGLGGGSVGDNVTGMIAVVHLKNPEIVELSGYVIFGYFFWRYWLFCPSLINKYNKNISTIMFGYPAFRSMAIRMAKKEFEKISNSQFVEEQFSNSISRSHVSLFRSSLFFDDQMFSSRGATISLKNFRVRIYPWYALAYGVRATVSHALKKDIVSEYLLPYIMAVFAACVLFMNHFGLLPKNLF